MKNYILNNNIIIPDSQYFGEIKLPIRISDEFFFLGQLYNNLSETAYLIIDVIGVNDAPVLESPYSSDLATPEGQSLVINNISVYDQDFDIIENNFNLKFEINVTHGTVSLGSISELLFDDNCNCDGIDDSFISFFS